MLNLSQQSHSDHHEGGSSIREDESDIGEPDIGSEEDMEYTEGGRDNHEKEDKETGAAPNSMQYVQMMNQIKSLIEMTVEKAKNEEKTTTNQKSKNEFIAIIFCCAKSFICHQVIVMKT